MQAARARRRGSAQVVAAAASENVRVAEPGRRRVDRELRGRRSARRLEFEPSAAAARRRTAVERGPSRASAPQSLERGLARTLRASLDVDRHALGPRFTLEAQAVERPRVERTSAVQVARRACPAARAGRPPGRHRAGVARSVVPRWPSRARSVRLVHVDDPLDERPSVCSARRREAALAQPRAQAGSPASRSTASRSAAASPAATSRQLSSSRRYSPLPPRAGRDDRPADRHRLERHEAPRLVPLDREQHGVARGVLARPARSGRAGRAARRRAARSSRVQPASPSPATTKPSGRTRRAPTRWPLRGSMPAGQQQPACPRRRGGAARKTAAS